MSFFAELKRRNVFKVGVAYAIVAWLLIQIIVSVEVPLHLPDWTDTFIIILLVIGFPVALIFAWAFELTPEGIKPTKSVVPKDSITHATGRKLDFIIIGVLALALLFVVVDKYVLTKDTSQETEVRSEEGEGRNEEAGEVSLTSEVLPNSVAVLPFENLSPDPDDAYFAMGLHEEILNQLVKLSKLNVISRTTMMRYADSNISPPEIARELNVGSVMEGSVRYAGQMIRVTLQLIDPVTDLHLWSETYNDDMRNIEQIFAMQADIAMNVANTLQAEFSPAEQTQIERVPTDSPEAYALYLQAQLHFNSFSLDGTLQGIEKIDRALELDPDFAQAWLTKSFLHANAPVFLGQRINEDQATAEQAVQRALEIAPESSEARNAFIGHMARRGEWLRAG